MNEINKKDSIKMSICCATLFPGLPINFRLFAGFDSPNFIVYFPNEQYSEIKSVSTFNQVTIYLQQSLKVTSHQTFRGGRRNERITQWTKIYWMITALVVVPMYTTLPSNSLELQPFSLDWK